jgi:NADH-quinone oxidoreductase subunit A
MPGPTRAPSCGGAFTGASDAAQPHRSEGEGEGYVLFDYVPILVQLLIAIGVALGVIAISNFVGTRKPSAAKLAPYESGMTPVGMAWRRFPIRFYLTAMLFVIFDVEIIFFFPWAVILRHMKAGGREYVLFGLAEMLVFMAFLLLGYVYIWKKGALQWE